MRLPDRVASYVQREILSRSRPFCILVDSQYRLVDTWGDDGWCGLEDIEPGADMRDACPVLVGSPLGEQQVYPFIHLARDSVAHIHLVPGEEGCYVIFLDASHEHEASQAKQQAMNELRLMHARQNLLIGRQRDLISELVEARSELDHHRREAERASASKSRFIAMMSHEFRTPLASILNYSELAREPGAGADQQQKSMETIERSARHLTSLVEALLDDASLAEGRLELQNDEFDSHAVFEDLAGMMAPMAAEKGLAFATFVDPDVPRRIHTDEVRLRQVLINLLGNAIKFTAEGGVQLLVTYSNNRLVVTVTDTGPGISKEDQERVFEAFERGGRGKESGAGLGLTITLGLVELMGGEVTLDSAPGDGCTVSIYVPVGIVDGAQADNATVLPSPGDETQASAGVSVLICDDDDDMIALIEHYLHRAGYGLITAADTSDAIAKTVRYDPDLVLMDCNVSGIGGVDAARVLRQQGYDKPIVALTASALDADDQSVFTRYFRKPAAMQELLGEIKRLTH